MPRSFSQQPGMQPQQQPIRSEANYYTETESEPTVEEATEQPEAYQVDEDNLIDSWNAVIDENLFVEAQEEEQYFMDIQ